MLLTAEESTSAEDDVEAAERAKVNECRQDDEKEGGEGEDAAAQEAVECRRQTAPAGGVRTRRSRCRDRRAKV